MPSTLTIVMQGDPDQRHGFYIASLLHGVIMDKIEPEYAAFLHANGAHPYSQSVLEDGDRIVWEIHALSEEAEQQILMPLMNKELTEIHLKHREETLQITERKFSGTGYEDLIQKYYFGNCSRFLRIRIRTPMSFRQNGRYCIFPSARLIFQSLMAKYDAACRETAIFSDELVQEFDNCAEITDYRLHTVRFNLEGVRIPSFLGELTIKINGPAQMANVAHMLAHFGEYSGIGIKTALGMGSIMVLSEPGRAEGAKTKKAK